MDTRAVVVVLIIALLGIAAQPSLPTTVYGQVTLPTGEPAELIEVFATWKDSDGLTHNSFATSLSADQAPLFGGSVGFYYFNKGEIAAHPSSDIIISASGSANTVSISASPGGAAVLTETIIVPDPNDKVAPIISNVRFRQGDASVLFSTNELSDAAVRFGTSSPKTQRSNRSLATEHRVQLTGLSEETAYVFEVFATDASANTRHDDNEGNYYEFVTGKAIPFAPTPNQAGSSQADPVNTEVTGQVVASRSDFTPQKPDLNNLPTTIYGQVTDLNGVPLGDIEVIADFDYGQVSTSTLTFTEALDLGTPDLEGFYFFQDQVVNPGESVPIKSDDGSYTATASSNPGATTRARTLTVHQTVAGRFPDIQEEPQSAQADPIPPSTIAVKPTVTREIPQINWGVVGPVILLIAAIALILMSFNKYITRPIKEKPQRAPKSSDVIKAPVKHVMTKHIVSLSNTYSLKDAIQLMINQEIGGVIVTANQQPQGWVTERSVVEDFYLKKKPLTTSLSKSTLVPYVAVSPDSSLIELNNAIAKTNDRRALVVSKGKMVGVVTSTEVAKALKAYFSKNPPKVDPPIRNIVTPHPYRLKQNDSLTRAAQFFDLNKIDFAIVEGETPAIITERDLMYQLHVNSANAANLHVTYAAKMPVKTIQPYLPLTQANDQMLSSFRRLGIMRDDALAAVLTQQALISKLISFVKRPKK